MIPVNKICLWTDSQCVIHWLNSTAKLERYVENRVKIIREYAVKYVTTEENPADLLTRGVNLQNLSAYTKWWTGPIWLNESTYAETENSPSFNPAEYAQRQVEVVPEPIQTFCLAVKSDSSIISLERFSSWRTAVRVTAYVLRFLDVIRKRQPRASHLTTEDLAKAQTVLLREAQRRQQPASDTQKSLALFLDDNEIWRCQGRIDESQVTDEAKKPIWLPPQDPITELIIQAEHKEANHAGSTITLARLRQRYWLSQGRRRIRNSIKKCCLRCRRYFALPYKLPNMPNLPESRVVQSRPFENTGLDYFGPIAVRYEKASETKKVWGCIFTCFVTRAIHLEIAFDLSAELFLDAFRRFIARRGTPRTIMSDNGTNFKLAAKVVSQSLANVTTAPSTQAFASDHGIKWTFTTERAPWRGGLWERLIHVIKNSLKRTVGRKILRMDEFSTLLAEIEMTVNLRPLTFLSEADSILPLRPVDFLLPYGIRSDVPITDNEDINDPEYYVRPVTRDKLVHAFNFSLQRIETFWKIWHSDYLLSLRERQRSLEFPQRQTSSSSPVVGEVVLIMDDDLPRNIWRLAIVEELIAGRDGEVRTARIRCGNRTTTRALNVLYPLEVSNRELQNSDCGSIQSTQTKKDQEMSLISVAFSNFSAMNDGNDVILDLSDSELDNDENRKPVEQETDKIKSSSFKTKQSVGNLAKAGKVKVYPKISEESRKIKKASAPIDKIKKASAPIDKIKKASAPIIQGRASVPMSKSQRAFVPTNVSQDTSVSMSAKLKRPSMPVKKTKEGSVPSAKIHKASTPSKQKAFTPNLVKPASKPNVGLLSLATVPTRNEQRSKSDQKLTPSTSHTKGLTISIQNEVRSVTTTTNALWSIDNNNAGWALTNHDHCQRQTVADIANTFDNPSVTEFAGNVHIIVPTLLQALHVRWALAHTTNIDRRTQIRSFIEKTCANAPEAVFAISNHYSPAIIRSDPKPLKVEDNRNIKQIIGLWRRTCQMADFSFSTEPWKPVVNAATFEQVKNQELRTALIETAGKLCRALTLSRRDNFYPTSTVIHSRTVIIGDDLISGITRRLPGVYFIRSEMKETAKTLNNLYFSAETKAVIICTGMSVVKGINTSVTFHKTLKAVDELAVNHQQIRWAIVSPPPVAHDSERSKRIRRAVEYRWRHLEVITGPGGTNLWDRPYGLSDTPNENECIQLFRKLTLNGFDILSIQEMEVIREPLDTRLKKLFGISHPRGECRGSREK